jgi:hypothetical protein
MQTIMTAETEKIIAHPFWERKKSHFRTRNYFLCSKCFDGKDYETIENLNNHVKKIHPNFKTETMCRNGPNCQNRYPDLLNPTKTICWFNHELSERIIDTNHPSLCEWEKPGKTRCRKAGHCSKDHLEGHIHIGISNRQKKVEKNKQ